MSLIDLLLVVQLNICLHETVIVHVLALLSVVSEF